MRGKRAALAAGGLAGAAGLACAAAGARREPSIDLHEQDWSLYEEGLQRRSYRSVGHFLHHLKKLLEAQALIAEIYIRKAISPAFRERIMLVTALANMCAWCQFAHRGFGRLAGLSEEDIRDLVTLDPARFDQREHAALCWVRETLTSREGASEESARRFEEAFDEEARRYIVAAAVSMHFFNLAGNTMDRWLRIITGRPPEQESYCSLVR